MSGVVVDTCLMLYINDFVKEQIGVPKILLEDVVYNRGTIAYYLFGTQCLPGHPLFHHYNYMPLHIYRIGPQVLLLCMFYRIVPQILYVLLVLLVRNILVLLYNTQDLLSVLLVLHL